DDGPRARRGRGRVPRLRRGRCARGRPGVAGGAARRLARLVALVELDQGGEPSRLPPAVLAVGGLHRHDGEGGAVGHVELGPRVVLPEPDGDDLLPRQTPDADDVAHGDAGLVRDGAHGRLPEAQPGQYERGEAEADEVAQRHLQVVDGHDDEERGQSEDGEDEEDRGHPARRPGAERTQQLRRDRHSREAWMEVTMIARAPTSYSSSITRLVSSRRTIARTARQLPSCSGETVGDSRPGVTATAFSTCSTGTS